VRERGFSSVTAPHGGAVTRPARRVGSREGPVMSVTAEPSSSYHVHARRTVALLLATSLVMMTLVGLAGPAAAATIAVDTTDDLDPGNCGEPGECSLRAAIAAAEHGDTVSVPAGRYELGATIAITRGITIQGAAAGLDEATATIIAPADAGATGRLLGATDAALDGRTLTLTDLTLTGARHDDFGAALDVSGPGTLVLERLRVHDNATDADLEIGGGGAIRVDDVEVVRITASVMSDNTSSDNGGAIRIANGATDVRIVDSTFTGNESGRRGGAVSLDRFQQTATVDVEVTITGNLFEDNVAARDGGAIASDTLTWEVDGALDVTIRDNRFIGNDAAPDALEPGIEGQGGAIYLDDLGEYHKGPIALTVVDNLFDGNTSNNEGGAVHLEDIGTEVLDGEGNSRSLTVALAGNTFTGNKAHTGGALYLEDIGSNSVGPVTLDVLDNRFEANRATRDGGAVYAEDLARSATGDLTVALSGNDLRNNEAVERDGGAIHLDTSFSSSEGRAELTIVDNHFEGNRSGDEGGAIYAEEFGRSAVGDVIVVIEDNLFAANRSADDGGAIHLDEIGLSATGSVELSILANRFAGNATEDGGDGGAVYLEEIGRSAEGEAKVLIARNHFEGNAADRSGGALGLDNIGRSTEGMVELIVTSNVFLDNVADGQGSAIQIWDTGRGKTDGVTFLVVRSAFIGNHGGAAVANFDDGDPVRALTLTDSTFVGNTASSGGSAVFVEENATLRFLTIVDHDVPFEHDASVRGQLVVRNSAFDQVTGCGDLASGPGNIVTPSADCSGTEVADLDVSDVFSPWYLTPGVNSPLLGASEGPCTDTDQRGKPRSSEGCAVGAVEYVAGIVCPDGPLPRGVELTCDVDTGLAGRSIPTTVALNPTLFSGPVAMGAAGVGSVSFSIPIDAPGDTLSVAATTADAWFSQTVTIPVVPAGTTADDVTQEDVVELVAEQLPATGAGGPWALSAFLLLLLGTMLVLGVRRQAMRRDP